MYVYRVFSKWKRITFAYIRIPSTPILAYLRTSLKTSLRKPSNLKAIQKMNSLRSGVKMVLMKKLSLYIFLVLMWCNTVQALMPCEGDDYKKWNNCDGSFTYEDGRKYSGEWQNGKKEGIGQQSFPDGFKIIAEFNNNGSPNGYGIGYLPSGGNHVGMFINGQKFGYGITISKNPSVMGETVKNLLSKS